MDIRSLLQANCDRLLEQYHSNLEAVLSLQATLIRDILPSVTDELELDPDATEWAKEWLKDTCEPTTSVGNARQNVNAMLYSASLFQISRVGYFDS